MGDILMNKRKNLSIRKFSLFAAIGLLFLILSNIFVKAYPNPEKTEFILIAVSQVIGNIKARRFKRHGNTHNKGQGRDCQEGRGLWSGRNRKVNAGFTVPRSRIHRHGRLDEGTERRQIPEARVLA